MSLAQVAEGSLTEIGNNLQRIRELSVQSANATNSSSDRAALNAEVKQLTAEIDRVAKQSEFNGTKLLDGSFSSQLFQVGANAGQAIAIDKVVDAKANALGGARFDSNALTLGNLTTNANVSISGLQINGVAIDTVQVTQGADGAATAAAARTAVATAINAKMGETGVYAEVNGTTGLTLTSVKDSSNADGSFKAITATVGTWTGTNAADIGQTYTATVAASAPARQFASNLDISSVKGAQQALEIVDKALTSVNSARADLGAVQNRFTSVVANLQTSSENLAASRSRIRDTDFAKETAELTRTQILQQAGTAMLAQANQVPQNVMSLLR
ncbi:MAG: flagellin [Herbaspirillum sp.]